MPICSFQFETAFIDNARDANLLRDRIELLEQLRAKVGKPVHVNAAIGSRLAFLTDCKISAKNLNVMLCGEKVFKGNGGGSRHARTDESSSTEADFIFANVPNFFKSSVRRLTPIPATLSSSDFKLRLRRSVL